METKELLLDMQESHKTILLDILDRLVPAGLEVWAFGSRARWTARETSDLDLVLRNSAQLEARLDAGLLDSLKEAFEESDLPFMVDLLDWATVSEKFRKVIDREYVVVRKGVRAGIREGWKEFRLGDLCKSVSITHKFDKDKLIFLNTGDIEKGKFLHRNYSLVNVMPGQAKKTIRKNDILFSEIRPANGRYALVDFDAEDYVVSTKLMVIRSNDKVFTKFLYQFLTSDETTSWLQHLAESRSGTFPQITFDQVADIEINLPSKSEQEKISEFISSLDEKIELNRQTNQTLEAIARALFKEWFVDFNFPGATGEMQESELGPIPVGWRVSTLKDLTVKIGSGATPRGGSGVYLDEGIALIRSQNVYDSEFVWDGLARISDEAAEQLRNVEVQQEDVLLNITGASILRTCVVVPEVLPARVNQHVAIIRANPGIPSRYIHLHLLQQKTKDYLMALDAGGSREAVTKVHIESVSILNPPLDLLARFDAVTSPVYSEIEQLSSQTRTLASTRDILLPKLMNGEIAV